MYIVVLVVLNQYITTATFTITCNWITLLQDARLTEGVRRYKEESWARVAEFMGDGLSELQCNITVDGATTWSPSREG